MKFLNLWADPISSFALAEARRGEPVLVLMLVRLGAKPVERRCGPGPVYPVDLQEQQGPFG